MHADPPIFELRFEVPSGRYQQQSLFEPAINHTTDVSTCEYNRILCGVEREIDRIVALQVEIELYVLDIAALVVNARELQRVYLL